MALQTACQSRPHSIFGEGLLTKKKAGVVGLVLREIVIVARRLQSDGKMGQTEELEVHPRGHVYLRPSKLKFGQVGEISWRGVER